MLYIGPENILFASAPVHNSARKEVLQAGAVKGLISGCGGFVPCVHVTLLVNQSIPFGSFPILLQLSVPLLRSFGFAGWFINSHSRFNAGLCRKSRVNSRVDIVLTNI